MRAGTGTEWTTRLFSSTPKATTHPISVRVTSGSTPSTEKVAASTMPAEVTTAPVTEDAQAEVTADTE